MSLDPAPDAHPESACSPPSWKAILALGLVSRAAVLLLGCGMAMVDQPAWLGAQDEKVATGNGALNARHLRALSTGARRWIRPWYRWDAIWYAEISRNGYVAEPGKQSSVAFLPLLPLVMRLGSMLGLDPYWVGLLVPNLAFSVGLVLFGKIAWQLVGDTEVVWRSCLLLVAFPWSFFFSAPYQESLAFMLGAAAILAWLRRKPGLCALSLGVASAARLTTVSMSVGVLLEWAGDLIHRRAPRHSAWLVALSGVLGISVFALYLHLTFGDPSLHFKAHGSWDRQRPSVLNILASATHLPLEFWLVEPPFDYLVMIAFLILGIRMWSRRGPLWGSLILVPILLLMASGSLRSATRVSLMAFPAFIEVAEVLSSRSLHMVCFASFLILQIIMTALYVNWCFVG